MQKLIDYLKFDIELSEWPAIEEMYESGVLHRVRQMGLEIHVEQLNTAGLHGYYQTLGLLEKAGMRRWSWAMNYYNLRKSTNGVRSCCYEMVYINSRFM